MKILPLYFEEELKKFNFTPIKNEKIKKIAKEICILEKYRFSCVAVKKFLKNDESKLENDSLVQFMVDILEMPELYNLSENSKYAVGILAYCEILVEISTSY